VTLDEYTRREVAAFLEAETENVGDLLRNALESDEASVTLPFHLKLYAGLVETLRDLPTFFPSVFENFSPLSI